jgi:hypothetical protein
MIALFPLAALLGVFACTLRSLGLGFAALFAVGYFSGVIRANFLGELTTFMFDFGLVGLYAGFFIGRSKDAAKVWTTPLGYWTIALIGWPFVMVFVPVNDFLVQLVALRSTVWFLPVMIIASRLGAADLLTISRALAVLNLFALAGGIYVYQNGIESLYPDNAVTGIIYRSKDVGGFEHYRIPSTFLSAHAYGGTMLFSLPFLLGRSLGRGSRLFDRILAGAGAVAAFAGILMCAARQPAIMFLATTIVLWVVTRFNLVIGFVAAGLTAVAILFASTNERLQRVTTVEDTEMISERVTMSANETIFELMADYPLGGGMGSSAGTSIPFFLMDRAPVAIGLENEYCRILIDQGLIGLGLWVGFIVWLFYRPPPYRLSATWGLGVMIMFALAATNWATAFIGTGTLSSVPGSVMLLTTMGVLVRVRSAERGGSPARPPLRETAEPLRGSLSGGTPA